MASRYVESDRGGLTERRLTTSRGDLGVRLRSAHVRAFLVSPVRPEGGDGLRDSRATLQLGDEFGDRRSLIPPTLVTSSGRDQPAPAVTNACPAVYAAARTTDYAVLPIENTLQGVVLETVDSLLSPLADPAFPSMGYVNPSERSLPTPSSPSSFSNPSNPSTGPEEQPYPHIIADTTLSISHQLVGLRGAKLEDITYVRSHEQALGQSSAWLDAHLPHAERVKWPSTAGALTSVLAQGDKRGAAICSRAAVERERERVGVLAEGVQGVKSESGCGGGEDGLREVANMGG